MKTIYFVRHGESESNINEIISGSGDEAQLTPNGRDQVKLAGRDLKDKRIELIICSPMVRTVDTATIIAKEIGYDPKLIIKNPTLIERSYGIYDGHHNAKYLEDVEAGNVHNSVESDKQMYERFLKAMEWLKGLPQTRIVVVGHGGTRRAFHVINEKMHHSEMYKLESFGNAKIYEFKL